MESSPFDRFGQLLLGHFGAALSHVCICVDTLVVPVVSLSTVRWQHNDTGKVQGMYPQLCCHSIAEIPTETQSLPLGQFVGKISSTVVLVGQYVIDVVRPLDHGQWIPRVFANDGRRQFIVAFSSMSDFPIVHLLHKGMVFADSYPRKVRFDSWIQRTVT